MPKKFTYIHIKPKDGGLVRDPVTMQPLPKAGKEVVFNTYWSRRVKAGDCTIESSKKKS